MNFIDIGIAVGVNAAGALLVARKIKKRLVSLEGEIREDFQDADAFVTGLLSTVNDRLGGRLTNLERYWTEANSKNVDLIARRALMEDALAVPQKMLREASMARIQQLEEDARKIVNPYDQFKQTLVNGRPSNG